MPQVMTATAPGSADLGSFGRASYMLICQHDFPDTYRDDETVHSADHDRCLMWDYNHARACFTRHIGTGELALGGWAARAGKAAVLAFCIDILKADPAVTWTGCRILGTVIRGNGYPVWTIEAFAKAPDSDTKVYSGGNAPNVKWPASVSADGTAFSIRGWR